MIKRILTFLILIPVFLSSYSFGVTVFGQSQPAVNARGKVFEEGRGERKEQVIARRLRRKEKVWEQRDFRRKKSELDTKLARDRAEKRKKNQEKKIRKSKRIRKVKRVKRKERKECIWAESCRKRKERSSRYIGLGERKRIASQERKCKRCQERAEYRERRYQRRCGFACKRKKEKRKVRRRKNKGRRKRKEKRTRHKRRRKNWQKRLDDKRETRKKEAEKWKAKKDKRAKIRKERNKKKINKRKKQKKVVAKKIERQPEYQPEYKSQQEPESEPENNLGHRIEKF